MDNLSEMGRLLVAGIRINELPVNPEPVRFASGTGQRFILTVDTEEEFDWHQPLDRHRHSIETVPALRKFQQFCEGQGIIPIYLMDYPVASSPGAREALREAIVAGRAEVGVQLHPWVNPPFDEVVNEFNSYAGNLPRELERDKLTRLRNTIETNFGVAPQIYRAGRYGVGPHTADALAGCGIAVDSSVRATFDYSSTGGPNFRDHPVRPYWLDRESGLIELPLTTVYWGLLRQLGHWLYPKMWRVPRLRGLLARIAMLERIPLTPEGVTLEEAIRGIDIAVDEGLPLLVLSFHSPSLAPGHTPYVRNEDDLDALYNWWRAVFAYLAQRKVQPTTIAGIMASVELA